MKNMAERQILKAFLEGKLKGLEGEGKPLPEHPEQAFVSAADAVAYRIMAEAGVLPEEIRIKKLIALQRDHLKTLTDEGSRKAAMAELATLEMRYGIATDARKRFMKD